MKRSFTLLILLGMMLGIQAPLWSQDAFADRLFTMSARVQGMDFSGLNAQGSELDYPALEPWAMELGAGVMTLDNRWKSTIELWAGVQPEPQAPGMARFQYAGLGFGTAFNVFSPTSGWYLGPEVVIHLRGEQLALASEAEVDNLADARQAEFTRLTRLTVPVEIGLNFHKAFAYGPEKTETFILSIRGGYRLDSEDDRWRVSNGPALNNPGIRTSGWYGGLVFAFGESK